MRAGEEMPASGEAAGLIPRAIGALFEKAGATEGLSMQATATFIEIYKEEVHDLLSWKEINPDGSGGLATLPIRENGPDGGLTLTGQQSKGVVSVDDCMGVLAEGARNRATGATAMNATSSRSHAIFTLALQIKTADGKSFAPKLHFVDLAGSERAKRTGASGERLAGGHPDQQGPPRSRQRHQCPVREAPPRAVSRLEAHASPPGFARRQLEDVDARVRLAGRHRHGGDAEHPQVRELRAADPQQAAPRAGPQPGAHLRAHGADQHALYAALALRGGRRAATTALRGRCCRAVGRREVAPTGAAPTGAAPTVSSAADGVLLRRVTQLQKENETLKKRIATLVAGGATPSASAGMPTGGVSSSGQQPALATLLEEGAEENANNDGSTSHRSSSGSSDAPSEGTLEAAQALGSLLTSEEESAYAQEAMEAELEFQVKQGELTEELEGLNASLALKQALLAQQPEEGEDGDAEAEEEIKHLCEALQSLEDKLKNVETERDAFHRQVSEPRMHSDESGPAEQGDAKAREARGRDRTAQEAARAAGGAPARRARRLSTASSSSRARSRRSRRSASS